jgi:hypothetical protein
MIRAFIFFAFLLVLSTVQGFVISRSPSKSVLGLGKARSIKKCLTATYMQMDEEKSGITPGHVTENGKVATSLASSSLTQVLVSNKQRDQSKPRGRFRSLVRRVIDTVFIWPGETVGSWVLGARGIPAKCPPFPDGEEHTGMQPMDAVDQEDYEYGPDMIPAPSSSSSEFQKAAFSGQPQDRGSDTYAQQTGRLDALMQRYSARRFGDADPTPQQERPSQGNDISEHMERRSAAASDLNDRTMQLLDSYAKRHEGARGGSGSQTVSRSGGRKPVYRSKYADFGEDKPAQTPPNSKRGQELQMRTESNNASSRLDQLMNRYAEKATKQPGSQWVKSVKKSAKNDEGVKSEGTAVEDGAKQADR